MQMQNVGKTEVVATLAKELGISQVLAKDAINKIGDIVQGTAQAMGKEGGKISLGFVTFYIKRREARMARNPKTGEKVKVPARMCVTAKVSAGLKGSL